MSQEAIPPLGGYSEAALDQAFAELTREVEASRQSLDSVEAIEQFRLYWLGRKQGRLKSISDAWLKSAPVEAKKLIGQHFNQLKAQIEGILSVSDSLLVPFDPRIPETADLPLAHLPSYGPLHAQLAQKAQDKLEAEKLDITLPGTHRALGAEHPLIKTMHEMVAVFQRMGYSVGVGPEVETDFYNFESLNFPPGHPARDTQDTLVVANQDRKPLRDRLLMRTHTSPVQIRTMEQQPPPVRIVIPGKVHRNDAADATHSPIFHQIEGLCVDTNITFSDLKGTLDHAMKEFFGSSVKTRFFPSFFPFTEPSADVQISCPFCGGKGCKKCKHSGWIELLGCGMVDPAVFGFVQGKQPAYDPKKISGFAFGMGVDRIAMMKYGISDIGLLYSGDVRFLEQFA
jgi:phenylalanyl-tRNA synthetase alpha chain